MVRTAAVATWLGGIVLIAGLLAAPHPAWANPLLQETPAAPQIVLGQAPQPPISIAGNLLGQAPLAVSAHVLAPSPETGARALAGSAPATRRSFYRAYRALALGATLQEVASPEPAPLPEPSVSLMFLLGLLSLAARRA